MPWCPSISSFLPDLDYPELGPVSMRNVNAPKPSGYGKLRHHDMTGSE